MYIKKRGKNRTLISNSKAQVSIFMIAAVIIIMLGALYFFYLRQEVEKPVEIIHPEIAPVKLYVDNCIKSVAEDGLERIGLSGGYISIPEKISNDVRAYLTTLPKIGFKIPYWWHDGIEAVPTEEFIRQQLEAHIKAELKNCINNFEPFVNRFEIKELKEKVVDVQFNENDVSVGLKYPLEIISKGGDLKQTIQNFGQSIPIRFKKVYELAKQIMDRENKDYFFEKRTIDLYSMDTDIPTTDVEVTCKTKTWRLSSIKEKLMTLLRVNLPYVRIEGTEYNPNLYVPNPSGKSIYSETYYQHHYVWDIEPNAGKKYANMKVSFLYDNWPLKIYARPSQNGILRSNSQKGTDVLSFLCIHIWHFTYDIEYPVLTTIFDQETKNNKAYRFSFAFKVAIDHNQPNRLNTGTLLFDTEPDLSAEDYCNTLQNEITIFTVNGVTGESIKDVNLTFACGRYYCDVGKSDWISFGAAAGIIKRFPYCINGIIKGVKEGFADSNSFMQTDVDGRSYVLMMSPIKEFKNYKVVKHLLSNPSVVEELNHNEKASIMISSKDNGYESFAVYPKEANSLLRFPDGIDATYELNIYLTDEENIVGGYIGNWTLGRDALRDSNEIIFHVISQGQADDDERFLFISGLSSYSKNIRQPELK